MANAYYTLLMLDSQYEIAVATEAAWKESVRTTRAMKNAGMVPDYVVSAHQIQGDELLLAYTLTQAEHQLFIYKKAGKKNE